MVGTFPDGVVQNLRGEIEDLGQPQLFALIDISRAGQAEQDEGRSLRPSGALFLIEEIGRALIQPGPPIDVRRESIPGHLAHDVVIR